MSLSLLIVLFGASLLSAESISSGRVRNEAESANHETILNNVKQDMLEHIKSLEDEKHGRIVTLKRQMDVIKNQNDVIRQENDLIKQQNAIVTTENDVIKNEIDLVKKEHGAINIENKVITEENDVIRKDNAELRARLLRLISRSSGSDEQVNVLRSCMQVIERQCDIRIRDMETTEGGQESTMEDGSFLPVAFLARRHGFVGSNTTNTTIPFDYVDLNVGEAYDPLTGVFTAPVNGIYEMSYEVLADYACENDNVCVMLRVNDESLSHSYGGYVASGGVGVTVQLSAGDRVTVDINSSFPCVAINLAYPNNKFSGHLVYRLFG